MPTILSMALFSVEVEHCIALRCKQRRYEQYTWKTTVQGAWKYIAALQQFHKKIAAHANTKKVANTITERKLKTKEDSSQ